MIHQDINVILETNPPTPSPYDRTLNHRTPFFPPVILGSHKALPLPLPLYCNITWLNTRHGSIRPAYCNRWGGDRVRGGHAHTGVYAADETRLFSLVRSHKDFRVSIFDTQAQIVIFYSGMRYQSSDAVKYVCGVPIRNFATEMQPKTRLAAHMIP